MSGTSTISPFFFPGPGDYIYMSFFTWQQCRTKEKKRMERLKKTARRACMWTKREFVNPCLWIVILCNARTFGSIHISSGGHVKKGKSVCRNSKHNTEAAKRSPHTIHAENIKNPDASRAVCEEERADTRRKNKPARSDARHGPHE